mgnify:CR=1 FL=1
MRSLRQVEHEDFGFLHAANSEPRFVGHCCSVTRVEGDAVERNRAAPVDDFPAGNDAVDGYVNAAEHALSAALASTLTASGYTTDEYDLEVSTSACSSATGYGAMPTDDSADFGVDEDRDEDFIAAMVKQAERLKVGNGLDEGVSMGPLANSRRLTAMTQFMADALSKGATIATGGNRIGDSGNFFAPTVLADVPLEAKVFNDEPFGPVAAIRCFDRIEDAIAESNRLPFGLASYAFTRSLKPR